LKALLGVTQGGQQFNPEVLKIAEPDSRAKVLVPVNRCRVAGSPTCQLVAVVIQGQTRLFAFA
jgi:hypothetical protein